MDKYKKIQNIGYGGYGDVYKGLNSMTNEAVILKELWFPDEKEGVPGTVVREISLLKEMEHENIARLLDVVINQYERSLYLVYEDLGLDLKTFMDTFPDLAKDPSLIKRILQHILRGVSYYHSNKNWHQDLKPQNLLIDRSINTLKLADFAWARAFGASYKAVGKQDLSLCYKAPELLLGYKQYSAPIDVWSVGCIFAEMVIHRPLFTGHTNVHQLSKIFSIMGTPNEETWPGVALSCPTAKCFSKCEPKDLAAFVPGLEPIGVDLLSKMLCVNPNRRITAHDALNHAYLDDVRSEI